MTKSPYSHIEKGTFLIATPEIDDGLFHRSVVLICEHNPTGSFGLVVNKSLDLVLPKELGNLEQLANPHVNVRSGGPVQTNQMMLLHTSDKVPEQTLEVCPGVFLGGDLNFLQEALTDTVGPYVHLCFGYSGWGAGQLEREFLNGHWLLFPATAKHLYHTHPERLWGRLLRDMGGKYASLSMIPEDLSLN